MIMKKKMTGSVHAALSQCYQCINVNEVQITDRKTKTQSIKPGVTH